jgi:hypothetical protein
MHLCFYIFSGDILQGFAKKACVECLLGLKTVFSDICRFACRPSSKLNRATFFSTWTSREIW